MPKPLANLAIDRQILWRHRVALLKAFISAIPNHKGPLSFHDDYDIHVWRIDGDGALRAAEYSFWR